jgi:hypothetical protein
MDVGAIVGNVMSVLLPYAAKGAHEFAKVAGEVALEKAKDMIALLRGKWIGDKEAGDTLTHFEQKPTRHETALREILAEKLANDPSLAAGLSNLIGQLGPQLEVVQRMSVGQSIVGLDADAMDAGRAKIQQDIGHAENVTGAKVKRFGSG